ncbi:MAG: NAD(P)H-dependent oxidoreductase subunit E [Clostridium sp.]|nr:NAD(P)H-dependent oxidoreductase subunit E [Clostridium sp.]
MQDCFQLNEKDKRFIRLREAIGQFKHQRGALIAVLHQAQEIYGFLPEKLQEHIAEELTVPLSEVCGVVSFYSYFSMKPRGKYLIRVCLGTACYVKGAGEIFAELSERLKISIGETSADGKFTLEASRCIGACGLAPVLSINDEIHGRLTTADTVKLLEAYRQRRSGDA